MNTTVEQLRLSNDFWKYFFDICSIPHPSGYEAQLRGFLLHKAEQSNLSCRVDSAGNLAIDRAAAPGCEKFPTIILQAHLDMVPQKAPGVEFDFLRDSIVPVIEDEWVTTGGKTTLGADDGMGVALAMELLTDRTLRCGALRALFTVSEETGLGGAENMDRSFLEADVLLNLDSDEPFTIGCAGGVRLVGCADLAMRKASLNTVGVEFALKGMRGGHSGVDIHLPLGSACCVINEFLRGLPGVEISTLHAGTLSNAIAREAVAVTALPAAALSDLERKLSDFNKHLNQIYTPADGEQIVLSAKVLPEVPGKVLESATQERLLDMWSKLPHGLLESTPDGKSVTSCNLAVVDGQENGEWSFILHPRSLYNEQRKDVSSRAAELLQSFGFSVAADSEYSSWRPQWDSPLLAYACKIYEELSGQPARKYVIHGGLEPGLFCGMNPTLQMLSFAPITRAVHSPQEKLNIPDVERSRRLLRVLLERANELQSK